MCRQCGKTYKFNQNLTEHIRFKCGKLPSFECPFCPKKCFVKRHLKSHVITCRVHHQIDDETFIEIFKNLFDKKNKHNRSLLVSL